MMLVQFIVVLVFIFIGARLGSLGIGLAGGAGIVVLALMGVPVDPTTGIPWDVLGIITAVTAALVGVVLPVIRRRRC